MAVTSPFFDVEQVRDVAVIRLTTDTIDSMNLDQVMRELTELVEAELPKKVLLNLSPIEYFHSLALGRLAALHWKIKRYGGELRLCNLQPAVYQVFVVTQLDRLLDVRSFEQTALRGWVEDSSGVPEQSATDHTT
jgi:anti-sigma B factor antagonist